MPSEPGMKSPITPGFKRRGEDLNQSTKKKQKPITDYTTSNNQFNHLKDDDDGSVIIDTPVKGKRTAPVNLPPIVLQTDLTNPKDTFKKVQAWVKNPVYFKKINDVRHVHASTKEDFYTLQNKFTEIGFKYYTHKPKDEIPKKLILKGLEGLYTPFEVFEDLKTQFDGVIEVKQLSKMTETGEKSAMDVYLVYFSYETRLSVAKKVIKYCCYHKIKLEYFKKSNKNTITQCYRCQRFGHQSQSCKLDFRCVKCTEIHAPGACAKKKEDKNAVCVNCGGDHPANYRGCTKAKEFMSRKRSTTTFKSRSERNDRGKSNTTIKFTPGRPNKMQQQQHLSQKKLNFSEVVRQQQHTHNHKSNNRNTMYTQQLSSSGHYRADNNMHVGPSMVSNSTYKHSDTTENFSFITGEIGSLFGVSMYEFMNSINTFVPRYKQCTDRLQKQTMLIEFMFNFAN